MGAQLGLNSTLIQVGCSTLARKNCAKIRCRASMSGPSRVPLAPGCVVDAINNRGVNLLGKLRQPANAFSRCPCRSNVCRRGGPKISDCCGKFYSPNLPAATCDRLRPAQLCGRGGVGYSDWEFRRRENARDAYHSRTCASYSGGYGTNNTADTVASAGDGRRVGRLLVAYSCRAVGRSGYMVLH